MVHPLSNFFSIKDPGTIGHGHPFDEIVTTQLNIILPQCFLESDLILIRRNGHTHGFNSLLF